MVLRSLPRWRAIAVIVQPRRRNACTSMSSSRVSMSGRNSLELDGGQRPPASRELRPFSAKPRGWGVSVSRTGEVQLSAIRYRSVRYYRTETGAWLAARPTVWLERIEGRSDRPIGGVPARELAQFIEDHLLARPVLGPVPAGGSLRHGSALTHRQPHGLGVPAQQAPGR